MTSHRQVAGRWNPQELEQGWNQGEPSGHNDVLMSASPQPEPFASRWKRRAVTIPTMLGATALALVLIPLLIPAAAVYDIVRLRWRLPSVRVLLFLVQYGVNDSIEILLAPIYWVAAGMGTQLNGPTSIRRHERIQHWSVENLARRAHRLLGVTVHLDPDGQAALEPAPAIVLCRHVSLMDASLPSLLYQRRGLNIRGVIMADLLADPGFDLLYGRLGNVFIPRDNGPEARLAVSALANGLDHSTVAVIFPEGRLFQPALARRFLAKLAVTDPPRGARLAGLRHVLPPRPGGVAALLAAAPDADVVVMAHVGLDGYASFSELARQVPLRAPVQVTAWRIARADIPGDGPEQTAWLDEQWVRMDAWIHERIVA